MADARERGASLADVDGFASATGKGVRGTVEGRSEAARHDLWLAATSVVRPRNPVASPSPGASQEDVWRAFVYTRSPMVYSALSARPARWFVILSLSAAFCAAVAIGCGRTTGPPPESADQAVPTGSASGPGCGDRPCPSGENCVQVLGCTLKDCVDRSTNPPSLTLACVANCLSGACPASQFFADQMTNCVATQFGTCVGGTSCIENACSTELSACIGATCGSDRTVGTKPSASRKEEPR